MEERRKEVRRQADKDLLVMVEDLAGGKLRKRKRRRAIRHTCRARLDIEIQFQSGGSSGWSTAQKEIKGRVLDLSEEGASLFIKYPVAAEQTFRLSIELNSSRTVEVQAQVRWVKQQESHEGYSIGVKFTHVDPAAYEHIHAFLGNLDATLGTGAELEE